MRDAHKTRCMRASEPSHALAVSGQPAGDPGVYWRCPRRSKLRITSSALVGAVSNARSVEKTRSSGVLNLGRDAFHASGDSNSLEYTSGRSPSDFKKAPATRSTTAPG